MGSTIFQHMHKEHYNIKIPHFYCLEYSEAEKNMTLDIDFRDSIIYLNTALLVKWNSPYENVPIKNEEKEKIIRNIYDYLVNKRGFSNVKM